MYLAAGSPEVTLKSAIAEYKLTEPNCVHYNLPEDQQRALQKYVVLTDYPTYRLIDKQGNLHHLNLNDDENIPEFKKKLDEMSR